MRQHYAVLNVIAVYGYMVVTWVESSDVRNVVLESVYLGQPFFLLMPRALKSWYTAPLVLPILSASL